MTTATEFLRVLKRVGLFESRRVGVGSEHMTHGATVRQDCLRFTVTGLGVTGRRTEITLLVDSTSFVTCLGTHGEMVEELISDVTVDAPFMFHLGLVVIVDGGEGVEQVPHVHFGILFKRLVSGQLDRNTVQRQKRNGVAQTAVTLAVLRLVSAVGTGTHPS